MKKLALALLAMTLLAPASPAFAAEEGESSARACTEPEAVWDYTAEEMTYQVAIDLSGCAWWDGSPIRLDVTLARLDAEGETVADSVTLCGVGPRVDGERRYRTTTCEGGVSLDHPGVEVARYRGEITYPWRDGEQTTGFTLFCTAPVLQCQDA